MTERITITCVCGQSFKGESMGDASIRWTQHLPSLLRYDDGRLEEWAWLSGAHEIAHIGRVVYAGGW